MLRFCNRRGLPPSVHEGWPGLLSVRYMSKQATRYEVKVRMDDKKKGKKRKGPSEKDLENELAILRRHRMRAVARDERIRERAENPREILMPYIATPRALAALFEVRVVDVLKEMIKLGEDPKSSEEVLEPNLADMLAYEFFFIPVREAIADPNVLSVKDDGVKRRQPVVVIMGHVDHGKTSLLDSLRGSRITEEEAGGITQRIAAFRVEHDDRLITFVDTPGHAAFSSLRGRGVTAADVVIVVIAADAGVQDQTDEILKLLEETKTPFIVAVNKVDKFNANPDMVYKQLQQRGIQVEQKGGEVQCVEISAIQQLGIEDLLTAINIQCEFLNLGIDPDSPCTGIVLETSKQKGKGVNAAVLLRTGGLHDGSTVVSGTVTGRVKSVEMCGEPMSCIFEAQAGMAVNITGFQGFPQPGKEILEVEDLQIAAKIVHYRKRLAQLQTKANLELDKAMQLREQARQRKLKQLQPAEDASPEELERIAAEQKRLEERKYVRLLLKGDSVGSIEALEQAIDELPLEDHNVEVEVLSTGVGDITDKDVQTAKYAEAALIGFNVSTTSQARTAARSEAWPVYETPIIYTAVGYIVKEIEKVLPPIIDTHVQGVAEVREVFMIGLKGKKKLAVAGCWVSSGVMARKHRVRVTRNGEVLHTSRMESLKSHKEDVKEAKKESECGISIVGWTDFQQGDVLECISSEAKPQKLPLPSQYQDRSTFDGMEKE